MIRGRNAGITTSGKIEADSIKVREVRVVGDVGQEGTGLSKATIGTVMMGVGETVKVVKTTSLTSRSKIFVTPVEEPVAVSARRVGEGEFEIRIKESLEDPINVNWWVVN